MKDRNKVHLVLAGMGMMGLLWAFMLADGGILPSASFAMYMAFVNCLMVLVAFSLKVRILGCLFLGSAVHLFLSGVAAMITIEVLDPAIQGGAGILWLALLSALLLRARSNTLPQRG